MKSRKTVEKRQMSDEHELLYFVPGFAEGFFYDSPAEK